MRIYARRELAPPTDDLRSPTLLLEGSWPTLDVAGNATSSHLVALDDAIDARYSGLDEDAGRIAEAIRAASIDAEGESLANLYALRLRYAAVKWLRLVHWLQSHAASIDDGLQLTVELPRDVEYVAVCRATAQALGLAVTIDDVATEGNRKSVVEAPLAAPANPLWRRLLGRWLASPTAVRADAGRPRVVLCGNPRLIDPLCEALRHRDAQVVWLYDRFAVGAWRRWHRRGVRQMVCDAASPPFSELPDRLLVRPMYYRDVDLTPAVEAWYAHERRRHGTDHLRLWRRVGQHFDRYQPTHVVVDQDATPLARAVVGQARRCGARSVLVQHGVCGVRFGFAPLAADRFLAWDAGAARQMLHWGVHADRIVVTGSPYVDAVRREICAVRLRDRFESPPRRPLRVALLGTTPPRDDRPDSVDFHLTTRTHAELWQAAFAALAELDDAEVWLRRHPRAGVDAELNQLLKTYPKLNLRTVDDLSAAEMLGRVDVVVGFPSSLGVEAAGAGVPVVQLKPRGAGTVVPADWYGLLGPVSTKGEVLEQLRIATSHEFAERRAANPHSIVEPDQSARRILQALFDEPLNPPTGNDARDSRTNAAPPIAEVLHG